MSLLQVREDFPVLGRKVHDKPLVYVDNAATTQKPRRVIDALTNYYEQYNANVHRAIHTLGEEATNAYEAAREKVARFIHSPESDCIVFTKNASEAINLVAAAWGRKNIGPGDEIVLTPMEHHSNLIPWQQLAKEKEARLVYVDLTDDGEIDMESFVRAISDKTRLVTMTQASNVLGTLPPIAKMSKIVAEHGAVFFVDGAQSAPHMPVDVQALGCDFFAFSAHKMCGPTGIGALYGKRELLEAMDPFMYGGEMISDVTLEKSTWNDIPYKFEAGTPNIAGAIGFGAAIDYLLGIGMDKVRAHEKELTQYALDAFQALPGMTIYGPRKERAGLISFNYSDIHPHDLSTALDLEGIAIRAGHHCAQPLMRHLDVPATARASFYVYNTKEDIDRIVNALLKTKEFFSHA